LKLAAKLAKYAGTPEDKRRVSVDTYDLIKTYARPWQ